MVLLFKIKVSVIKRVEQLAIFSLKLAPEPSDCLSTGGEDGLIISAIFARRSTLYNRQGSHENSSSN
jgi:hypothetical protein